MCLGRGENLDAVRHDAEICPACAVSGTDEAVSSAALSFAVNVLKYDENAMRMERILWAYSDKVYPRVRELRERYGDLRLYDLILTRISAGYHIYSIDVTEHSLLDTLEGRNTIKAWVADKLKPLEMRPQLAKKVSPAQLHKIANESGYVPF